MRIDAAPVASGLVVADGCAARPGGRRRGRWDAVWVLRGKAPCCAWIPTGSGDRPPGAGAPTGRWRWGGGGLGGQRAGYGDARVDPGAAVTARFGAYVVAVAHGVLWSYAVRTGQGDGFSRIDAHTLRPPAAGGQGRAGRRAPSGVHSRRHACGPRRLRTIGSGGCRCGRSGPRLTICWRTGWPRTRAWCGCCRVPATPAARAIRRPAAGLDRAPEVTATTPLPDLPSAWRSGHAWRRRGLLAGPYTGCRTVRHPAAGRSRLRRVTVVAESAGIRPDVLAAVLTGPGWARRCASFFTWCRRSVWAPRHGSIARSAPLGAAAPLPEGAMRSRRFRHRTKEWRLSINPRSKG